MGTVTRNLPVAARREIYAVPLVYAFLTSKAKTQYVAVLRGIIQAALEMRVENCVPQKIMGDFEMGIISASLEVFPESQYKGCYFHFTHSIYRKVVDLHLRQEYNDPNNR